MRVAFMMQPYDFILPPRQSSIGLIAYNTALLLGKRAEVALFGSRLGSAAPPAGLPFRVSFVSSPSDNLLQYAAIHYPRWAGRLGIARLADAYWGYARAVSRQLSRFRPDVVHVMNNWWWCPLLRKRFPRARIVLSMHSEWLSQANATLVSRALEGADAVVAVSDHVTGLIRAALPSYRGAVLTVYNGVDVDEFRSGASGEPRGDGVPRVLFVGRVSPEKGIHTLIEAFAQVVARVPSAHLDIVGSRSTLREDFIVGISDDPAVRALKRFYDGSTGAEYQDYLDRRVQALRLAERVHFIGRVSHGQLPGRYRASAVLVNPSLSESFGLSVVEAMASGLPVVATRVGGMAETVVDGDTGLLVDPEQPEALAEAIASLLRDADRSRRMGASGRSRAVARYSWEARTQRLLSTYGMLLERTRA